MIRIARPVKEFDVKQFVDLVGLGCGADEIRWWFRDERGKIANMGTLTSWCKRTFGMGFHEYMTQNGGMALKIKLRRNQMKLSEKSAAMAIFLGKQILQQSDNPDHGEGVDDPLMKLLGDLDEQSKV